MTKNIIPTINISSLVKNGFETPNSIKVINKIKKGVTKNKAVANPKGNTVNEI